VYFIFEDDQTNGPFSAETVREMATPTTLVSHEKQWVVFQDHPDFSRSPGGRHRPKQQQPLTTWGPNKTVLAIGVLFVGGSIVVVAMLAVLFSIFGTSQKSTKRYGPRSQNDQSVLYSRSLADPSQVPILTAVVADSARTFQLSEYVNPPDRYPDLAPNIDRLERESAQESDEFIRREIEKQINELESEASDRFQAEIDEFYSSGAIYIWAGEINEVRYSFQDEAWLLFSDSIQALDRRYSQIMLGGDKETDLMPSLALWKDGCFIHMTEKAASENRDELRSVDRVEVLLQFYGPRHEYEFSPVEANWPRANPIAFRYCSTASAGCGAWIIQSGCDWPPPPGCRWRTDIKAFPSAQLTYYSETFDSNEDCEFYREKLQKETELYPSFCECTLDNHSFKQIR
jgi:hypothetical protein